MMHPCKNCLENNWTYKHIDGFIIATCQNCGYEVEFPARKKIVYNEGDVCNKCHKGKLILRKPRKHKKNTAYYFEYYHYCPECRQIFNSEKFKRFHL